MGNPKWSYEEMLREADRIIASEVKNNANTEIKDIEERINSYKHDSKFYFYCGMSASNVMMDIYRNGSCDELNACVDGLDMFWKFIGLD